MRRLLALALAVGCGSPPDQPFPRIDAVVYDSRVVVYARDAVRPCECNTAELPPVGGCVTLTDVIGCGCEPVPADCLSSIAIEDGGQVVRSAPWVGENGALVLPGSIEGLDAPELVAVGCGGEARASLVAEPPPTPPIDQLVYDERTLGIETAPVDASSYLGGIDFTLGGTRCRTAPVATVAVPAPFSFEYGQPDALLYALSSDERGAVTVHRARGSRVRNLFLPNQLSDGRWTLPPFTDRAPTVTVTIDGDAISDRIVPSLAAFDLDGAERLVELDGTGLSEIATFRHRPGPAGDELSITAAGGTLSGTVAHVAALDPLDVGGPEQERYHVRLTGVELAWEEGGTAVVTVDLAWELGVVARPVGAVSESRR